MAGASCLKSLLNLAKAAEELRKEAAEEMKEDASWLEFAKTLMVEVGSGIKLAAMLGVSSPYLYRVLNGTKPLSAEMIERLRLIQKDRAIS